MRTRTFVAFLALAFAAGCQLFVDLDGLEDRHCGPDEKSCPNACVPNNDPTTGCNDPGCAPCAPRHAVGTCSPSNHCSFDRTTCIAPWDDCNGIPDDGCETDLAHSAIHCGDCNTVCVKPRNGFAGCSQGKCVIGGCIPGFDDCNGDPSDGCEHPIWTDAECLACKLPCQDGTHCAQGVCL